jgi:hypothetical protein
MRRLFEVMSDLVTTVLKFVFIGAGILLLASEVRLATMKKISQGSFRLSGFTEKMTGQKPKF